MAFQHSFLGRVTLNAAAHLIVLVVVVFQFFRALNYKIKEMAASRILRRTQRQFDVESVETNDSTHPTASVADNTHKYGSDLGGIAEGLDRG